MTQAGETGEPEIAIPAKRGLKVLIEVRATHQAAGEIAEGRGMPVREPHSVGVSGPTLRQSYGRVLR